MKFRAATLTIYIGASLAAPSAAHAETVANSQNPPQARMAPLNLQPVLATTNTPWKVPGRDEPIIGADRGGEAEIQKWMKHFDLVVVVDKGSKPESLTAYRNVGTPDAPILDKAIDHVSVSTGVEDSFCHQVMDREPDENGMRWVEKVVPIWRHTPTGYYVPKKLDVDHYSSLYDDSHMRNAVGWDSDNGFYSHEAPGGSFGLLGQKASHGCIRMHTDDSQDLFTMTLMTGGPFNENIDEGLNAKCPDDPEHQENKCTPDPRVGASLRKYFTNVEHQIFPQNNDPKKGAIRDLRNHLPRLKAYDTQQDVPVISKSGIIQADAVSGTMKTQPGYKTLYIVKDSSSPTTVLPKLVNGVNVSVPVPPPPKCPSVAEANANIAQKMRDAGKVVYAPGTQSQDPIGDFFRRTFTPHP